MLHSAHTVSVKRSQATRLSSNFARFLVMTLS